MFLEFNQEEYAKFQTIDNTLPVLYLDELFQKISNFKYSEFTLPSIEDGCKNKEFKEKLFNFSCSLLNINSDELIDKFDNIQDENSEALGNLIKLRYSRFQMVIIEFIFEFLPFNHLRKISNKIKGNQLGEIKNLYDLINNSEANNINIKEILIELLYEEIRKINNIDSTMNTLANQIQNREQAKKLNNIKNASLSVSKKVINENLLIINIIENCPLDNINNIVLKLLDDNLIASNLL